MREENLQRSKIVRDGKDGHSSDGSHMKTAQSPATNRVKAVYIKDPNTETISEELSKLRSFSIDLQD